MQNNHIGAIYHYSNSHIRTYICNNELDRIQAYAQSKGFSDTEIFCDLMGRGYEHTQFNKMMSSCSRFKAIFVKDYTHIDKYTSQLIRLISDLHTNGLEIHSAENTMITLQDELPEQFMFPRVATYYCHWGNKDNRDNEVLKNDILKHFAEHKLNASTVFQYTDECKKGHAGSQPQLNQLIHDKDKYDLLLTQSFSSVHWRTYNFCNFREQLSMGIYSMTEGLLTYPEE